MVVSETTLFTYCRQVVGVPYPSGKDIGAAKKIINDIWSNHPHITGDYELLANIANWASARKKRYATIAGLLGSWRYAYQDGYLEALNVQVKEADLMYQDLTDMLNVENNKEWRDKLNWSYGQGLDVFKETMLEWETNRLPQIGKETK